MTAGEKPSWKRLALHGGTFGAVAGLFILAPPLGESWHPDQARHIEAFLLGAIPVGILAGALAAFQVLIMRTQASPRIVRWFSWPAGALLGGFAFGVFALLALGNIYLALFTASIWTFGWLCFFWGRSSL